MKKSDPIGEFLGRLILRRIAPLQRLPDEEQKKAYGVAVGVREFYLKHFRLSFDPPETWKSLLLWALIAGGFLLAWLAPK